MLQLQWKLIITERVKKEEEDDEEQEERRIKLEKKHIKLKKKKKTVIVMWTNWIINIKEKYSLILLQLIEQSVRFGLKRIIRIYLFPLCTLKHTQMNEKWMKFNCIFPPLKLLKNWFWRSRAHHKTIRLFSYISLYLSCSHSLSLFLLPPIQCHSETIEA